MSALVATIAAALAAGAIGLAAAWAPFLTIAKLKTEIGLKNRYGDAGFLLPMYTGMALAVLNATIVLSTSPSKAARALGSLTLFCFLALPFPFVTQQLLT
jgi:hypothetical protein